MPSGHHHVSMPCVRRPCTRNLPRFQHYLEAVLEAADDFHEIPDIIARHAMLEAVQHDLRRQQQAAAEDTETAKHAPPQLAFRHLSVICKLGVLNFCFW